MTGTASAADSAAMEALGARLADAPDLRGAVHLSGALGSGKTTFVRGALRALGETGAVRSPTFTLLEPYSFGTLEVYHFDFYRLNDPEELELIGVRDYLGAGALCFVEWPERAGRWLPAPDLAIRIAIATGEVRHLELTARSARGRAWAAALSAV